MYSKSMRIFAFVMLLILLSSTAAFAQSGDIGEGELIELPTTPLPPEEIDNTPIPDAEPVPTEPDHEQKPLEARGQVVVDTDNANNSDVLGTQIILSTGVAITAIVLIIGIAGGRSGNRRR